jgi:large subunit ribosomal protein L2
MVMRKSKPITSGRRFALYLKTDHLAPNKPVKSLSKRAKKTGGRNCQGRVTIRHRGGGHSRFLRLVQFRRQDKLEIPGRVVALEYDPNRNANLALIHYADGEKAYFLGPLGLKVNDQVLASASAEIKPGNALPLEKIPVGTLVHNLEISPGRGGQVVRGAGSAATILGKEDKLVVLKLPSGERKRFLKECFATVGQVGNPEARLVVLGKAGRKRHLGIRPSVRGVAMHPGAHPHGGGEGRSGIGMPSPKTPWGKKALGKKTRKKKKYSDKLIIKSRG